MRSRPRRPCDGSSRRTRSSSSRVGRRSSAFRPARARAWPSSRRPPIPSISDSRSMRPTGRCSPSPRPVRRRLPSRAPSRSRSATPCSAPPRRSESRSRVSRGPSPGRRLPPRVPRTRLLLGVGRSIPEVLPELPTRRRGPRRWSPGRPGCAGASPIACSRSGASPYPSRSTSTPVAPSRSVESETHATLRLVDPSGRVVASDATRSGVARVFVHPASDERLRAYVRGASPSTLRVFEAPP